MRKHVSSRMLRGIALLVLILAAITLGIRIYLDEALIRHASTVTTEAAPSETREQLIIAETTPAQESEAAEEAVDQIALFEAAFAEIQAPVLESLDVNLSGRYDHYSSGQANFSPKAGARFTPFRQLTVRGTWSRGFRIPSFAVSFLTHSSPAPLSGV